MHPKYYKGQTDKRASEIVTTHRVCKYFVESLGYGARCPGYGGINVKNFTYPHAQGV